jgi:SpoVK/Ycf46/Vps4 family AAA+-type ATPase
LLTEFHPTASSPKSFDDVVGIETTKQQLQEDIIDYIENPELKELDKQEYGIEASSTILFYGPPGCGKTYITEALASQSGLKMFKIDISKIGSKYVNQTSGNIQKAFDYIAQVAKEEDKPVLLFVDELDSLAISRESMKGSSGENLKTTSTLLKLIQEAKDKNIIIIGATNKRGLIDAALLDRFGTETYFGLPDKEAIKKLLIAKLGKITKGQNLAKDDESIDELAESLQGYSNRTIVHITQEAAKLAKRNSRSDITFEIFNQAIEQCEHEKIDEKTYRKESARKIGFI